MDVWDHVDYTDTGRTEPGKSGTFDKVCKVPGGAQAPYLCGHKRFDCAIHMYNKEESDEDEGAGCLRSLVKSYIVGLLCSQAWTIPSHRAAWLMAGVAHPRSLALAPCPTAGLLWPSMPFRLH